MVAHQSRTVLHLNVADLLYVAGLPVQVPLRVPSALLTSAGTAGYRAEESNYWRGAVTKIWLRIVKVFSDTWLVQRLVRYTQGRRRS